MQSTLRLFKALPVETKTAKTDEALLQKTAQYGFIVTPEVIANYPDSTRLIDMINQAYGRSSVELNQSFHKSWAKVRDASDEQLVLEQIVHYLTTYGFEELGIYSEDSVYIPAEQLNAPELKDGIRLVVIKGLTKEEIKDKLLDLLGSGIALHKNTVEDVLDVASFVEIAEDDIDRVKNKEVRAALYDYFNIVPGNPTEFLRYVVYRATNKTLLIKNRALVNEIKDRDNIDITRYFEVYEREFGLARLAEVFYRYKPLFLAMRTNTKLKRIINRIRRLAVANHKPMKRDLLNDVTAGLKRGYNIDAESFERELAQASTFRKIRLAYALKFRTTRADSIMYRVRNGKSYAKEFGFDHPELAQSALETVMASIVKDIASNVAGKKVFIPTGMKYGLPATEKQFTGNLPSGSYAEIPRDMVCGVHWTNQGNHRIDLDLSIMNAEVGKIGWDSSYRTADGSVLFSGDMTDAPKPHGASELFYIGKEVRGVFIMFVNYYNYMENVPVPFKILVAHQVPARPNQHYTVDPNNIVAQANSVMDVKQKNLGIIVADNNSCRFYFAESNLGRGNSARGNAHTEQARKYLLNYYTDALLLNDVLIAAGAELVESPADADIDLSPEAIDKDSIIALLRSENNG